MQQALHWAQDTTPRITIRGRGPSRAHTSCFLLHTTVKKVQIYATSKCGLFEDKDPVQQVRTLLASWVSISHPCLPFQKNLSDFVQVSKSAQIKLCTSQTLLQLAGPLDAILANEMELGKSRKSVVLPIKRRNRWAGAFSPLSFTFPQSSQQFSCLECYHVTWR